MIIENIAAMEQFKDSSNYINQLVFARRKNLIGHRFGYDESLIDEGCVGIMRDPGLVSYGDSLSIYTSSLYACLVNELRMYYGPTMIGPSYPIFTRVPDLGKNIIGRDGKDYGPMLIIVLGNSSVLEYAASDEKYRKHIEDYREYCKNIGTP